MTAEPLSQTGKAALTPEFTKAASETLEKHELLRTSAFQNCLENLKETMACLTTRTKSEVVQVTGKKIALCRQAKEEKYCKIMLPCDQTAMRQTAILGGTFDSVHNGHLELAEEACSHFPLDACWFMSAAVPPHEQDRKPASYVQRLRMAELAAVPYEAFCVSDSEAKRRGLSYTGDILALLCETYPDCAFSLILGVDSFFRLEFWHAPVDICRGVRLLVAAREYADRYTSLHEYVGHLRAPFGAWIELIPVPPVDISSMHIHAPLAADKKSAAQYPPPAVYDYIQIEGLYRRQKGGSPLTGKKWPKYAANQRKI